jgi:hypothetical protein
VNQTSVDDQIAQVVRRLSAALDLPPTTIEHEVRVAFGGWEQATIRDFVPIFVEREVRRRLRDVERSGATST